jgi:predicted nucleic acid-binding Zn ribbon protein
MILSSPHPSEEAGKPFHKCSNRGRDILQHKIHRARAHGIAHAANIYNPRVHHKHCVNCKSSGAMPRGDPLPAAPWLAIRRNKGWGTLHKTQAQHHALWAHRHTDCTDQTTTARVEKRVWVTVKLRTDQMIGSPSHKLAVCWSHQHPNVLCLHELSGTVFGG